MHQIRRILDLAIEGYTIRTTLKLIAVARRTINEIWNWLQTAVKVFFVKFESQANIKILAKIFPK